MQRAGQHLHCVLQRLELHILPALGARQLVPGEPRSRCSCGRGEPGPGADVGEVSPGPGADVGEVSAVPAPHALSETRAYNKRKWHAAR